MRSPLQVFLSGMQDANVAFVRPGDLKADADPGELAGALASSRRARQRLQLPFKLAGIVATV